MAAITITFSFGSKPSISTSIWFNVCSLSSFPPPTPVPLTLPTASISSIKTIEGADFLASLNKSLTREAPTPTNISTNSEPDKWKKGTLASPATALASNVFPVPGAPVKITPFGILAPISRNFLGLRRKSTISVNSSLASLTPATSLNVTLLFLSFGSVILALDCPKVKACIPCPLACRLSIQKKNPTIISGRRNGNKLKIQ